MKIRLGVSNRHLHLTEEDYHLLFDEEMTKRNDLYQPNCFAAEQIVTIKGPKKEINNVRIIGPCRPYTQVEISKTDSYTLGLNPPIRTSGDLSDAEEITIITKKGSITRKAAIIANRHIHITKEEQIKNNLPDLVKIKISGEKSTILENVHLKISDDAIPEVHLDTDDSNACLLKTGDELEILSK